MGRLAKWNAALARARSVGGSARLLMLGDSTTFGYGAQGGAGYLRTPLSVPSQLAALLTAECGARVQANGWMGFSHPAGDPRITLGEGWTATDTPKSLGGPTITAMRAGGALSFAPGVAADTFTVWYIANPGNGAMSIAVDGGISVGVGTGHGNSVSHATVTAGLGLHTLRIIPTTIASGLYIVGCEASDSAADRISVINAGWQGATSGQIADARDYFSSCSVIPRIGADLTTVGVGINDWYSGVDLRHFHANVMACVNAARSCGDVAIFTPNPTNPGIIPRDRQRSYVQELVRISEEHDIPIIDVYEGFGSWDTAAQSGFMNDDVHPNAAGYGQVTRAAVEVICPAYTGSGRREQPDHGQV